MRQHLCILSPWSRVWGSEPAILVFPPLFLRVMKRQGSFERHGHVGSLFLQESSYFLQMVFKSESKHSSQIVFIWYFTWPVWLVCTNASNSFPHTMSRFPGWAPLFRFPLCEGSISTFPGFLLFSFQHPCWHGWWPISLHFLKTLPACIAAVRGLRGDWEQRWYERRTGEMVATHSTTLKSWWTSVLSVTWEFSLLFASLRNPGLWPSCWALSQFPSTQSLSISELPHPFLWDCQQWPQFLLTLSGQAQSPLGLTPLSLSLFSR